MSANAEKQKTPGITGSRNNFFKDRFYIDIAVMIAAMCIFTFVCYITFTSAGKSMIRQVDGTEQHYLFFVYIGEWLRGIARNLISGNGLVIPIWNMNMGYGADMLTTTAAYIADPFNWLAVFDKWVSAEDLFCGTLIARMFCACFTFWMFCRHRDYNRWASVAASVLYATCGVMLIAFQQSFFINPMILFPLIVWGIDNLFDGKSPVLFIVTLGLLFLEYFYFGYMACILLVPICIGEYIRRGNAGKKSLSNFVKVLGKTVGCIIVSVGIACVMVLPILDVLMSAGRLSADRPLDILYSPDYYISLLIGTSSFADIGPDSRFGFGALGVVCLLLLVCQKGNKPEKVVLATFTVFLLIPFFGKVFNGFAYVANRWVWGYAFIVAQTLAICLPKVKEMSNTRMTVFGVLCVAYGVFMGWLAFDPAAGDFAPLYMSVAVAMACMLVFVLLAFAGIGGKSLEKASIPVVCSSALVGVLVCSSLTVACVFSGDVMEEEEDLGNAEAALTEGTSYELLKEHVDTQASNVDWRFDKRIPGEYRNAALFNKVNSYDFYISIYNDRIDKLHQLVGMNGTVINMSYQHVDSRAWLERAFSTKYFVMHTGQERFLPYHFEKIAEDDDLMDLYEDHGFRPIASVCDTVFSYDDFMDAGMTERGEMLGSGIVIDDDGSQTETYDPSIEYIDFTLKAKGGLEEIEYGKEYEAFDDEGYLVIEFDGDDDCDFHIELEGISLAPQDNGDVQTFSIKGDGGELLAGAVIPNARNHMDGGKDSWVVNLGYCGKGHHRYKMEFPKEGTYKFSSFKMVKAPFYAIDDAKVHVNSNGSYATMETSVNTVKSHVKIEDGQRYLLCVPYSTGWKATVDGQPTEVKVANYAFMTLDLEPGEHDVVFTYFTPKLKLGLAVTLASIAATIAIGILSSFRRRKGKGDGAVMLEGQD